MERESTFGLDLINCAPEVNFPEDTQLHFVFWEHKPSNFEHLIEPFRYEALIAAEYARTDDLVKFRDDFAAYNAVLSGTATIEQEATVKYRRSDGDVSAFLADEFRGTGKVIVPIDGFEYSEDRNHVTQHITEQAFYSASSTTEEEFLNLSYHIAKWAYNREVLSLGQLSSIAREFKQSGDVPRIAVLYGAAHTPLYHYTRNIGVDVSREFAGEFGMDSLGALARSIRWNAQKGVDLSDRYRVGITPDMRIYAAAAVAASKIIESLYTESSEIAASKKYGYPNSKDSLIIESHDYITSVADNLSRNSALFARRIASGAPETRIITQKILDQYSKRYKGLTINRGARVIRAIDGLRSLVEIS